MKAFAWILTAAAILIGAEVVMSPDASAQPASAVLTENGPVALHGGTGMPPPPPDAY